MKSKKWTFSIIAVVIISILSIFLLGFKLTINKTPSEVYAIYLEGKKIGVVKSKEEFDEYINVQEEKLKTQYGVDKIYTPKGVEIKKIVTYDNKYNTNEEIYNILVKQQNFTIKGIIIEIEKEVSNDNQEDEEEKKTETITINVINKEIFDESVVDIVKAFVDNEEYTKFMNSTQEPITDVGEIIENIYIKEKITYREGYISTNENIFTDKSLLTKYLLYGTTEEQSTYIVKEGDTIESIATANKLNTQEFLIANPEFTSVNNLLYESQEVVVGLIDPIISIVVEKHSVQEEVSKYATEIKYDDELIIGYSYTEREGEDGIDKVTRKYQYINGQLVDVAMVGSVEIKPSVSKILVKGDKYVPNVADLSYWAWPTSTPYTITTYYQYRWGTFHAAIDIYVGFGSPIYAANNGTVYAVGDGCVRGATGCNGTRGNYIIINHNAGNYYTQYMHLNTILVKPGQTVARGQKIATMGNTGYVVPTPAYGSSSYEGTHLDFGVWKGIPYNGGYTINPLNLY
ncbi:MAG: peptidoglycan DD-metalloendopeptidase family protein [Bacilli bacterium]